MLSSPSRFAPTENSAIVLSGDVAEVRGRPLVDPPVGEVAVQLRAAQLGTWGRRRSERRRAVRRRSRAAGAGRPARRATAAREAARQRQPRDDDEDHEHRRERDPHALGHRGKPRRCARAVPSAIRRARPIGDPASATLAASALERNPNQPGSIARPRPASVLLTRRAEPLRFSLLPEQVARRESAPMPTAQARHRTAQARTTCGPCRGRGVPISGASRAARRRGRGRRSG